MADKPVARSKRRTVKDPETFRERSLKAAAASGKPSAAMRLKSVGGKVTKPIIQPTLRGVRRLGTVQPFKFIYKLIHWIGLVVVPPYLRSSWKELKLVTWPTRRQSRQLTIAVLIFAIAFGAVVALVDFGLDKAFRHILLK